MSDPPVRKPPRFVLTSFPERYQLPVRPPNASAQVVDAHRQTGFLLGDDLAVFDRAMNLQLQVVTANAKAKGAPALALFSFWSRAFAFLADACTLMASGSYGSCAPLLRSALDCIAAQQSFIEDGFVEYEKWHANAVSQEKTRAATVIDIERFRAAGVLIENPELGLLYRLLSDLSMPHVGGTLFLTAPETSLQKLPVGFADSSFHLAWAELVTGWLLTLAGLQLKVASGSGVVTLNAALASDCEAVQRDVREVVASSRRCHVEDADGRFVFHNFRRSPTGQPKRVILG